MAAMVAKGLEVFCSKEAELLACRKAIEFAVDAGFSELVIEGDNNSAMTAISTLKIDQSLLGNVVGDIQHLIWNLLWVRIDCIRRGGNRVAHVLAQFARNITEDMHWMEDVPPIAREALYQMLILLINWMIWYASVSKKKKKNQFVYAFLLKKIKIKICYYCNICWWFQSCEGSKRVNKNKKMFKEWEFEIKDLGKTEFCLGLQIEYLPNEILVHHSMYIKNILKHFYIDKDHPLSTPMVG